MRRLALAAAVAAMAATLSIACGGVTDCEQRFEHNVNTWDISASGKTLAQGCAIDATSLGARPGDEQRGQQVVIHAAVGDVVTESLQNFDRTHDARTCAEVHDFSSLGSDSPYWCGPVGSDERFDGADEYRCAVPASSSEPADILGIAISADKTTATVQYRIKAAGVLHLRFDPACASWLEAGQNNGWAELTIVAP